jgi:hypothetical protein
MLTISPSKCFGRLADEEPDVVRMISLVDPSNILVQAILEFLIVARPGKLTIQRQFSFFAGDADYCSSFARKCCSIESKYPFQSATASLSAFSIMIIGALAP